MDTWNRQQMPGCTHSICITCADHMQANLHDDDTGDMSDDESESSLDLSEPVEPVEESYYDPSIEYEHIQFQDYPMDYTIKFSLEGYKITRVNYYDLQGYFDPMKCPYCRQHGPMWYDFGELRYCVPSHTSEWNTLERKLDKGTLTSYTMKRHGATFAFKLIHDKQVLRIMWTEVNQYGFAPVVVHEKSYVEPILTKCPKDSRTYNRKKTFTKMVR